MAYGIFIFKLWGYIQDLNKDWQGNLGTKHNKLARELINYELKTKTSLNEIDFSKIYVDCTSTNRSWLQRTGKEICLSNMKSKRDSKGSNGWICRDQINWELPDKPLIWCERCVRSYVWQKKRHVAIKIIEEYNNIESLKPRFV